jgi:hypothetical protein
VIKIMADSAEQKKKDARFRKRATERKRKAAEAKEKRRLAKVPQRKGGTAAPKLYKKPSKEAIAKGQKEIESTSPPQIHDDWTIEELVTDRDTRAKWDVGRGGKRGQLRGADIPLRTAEKSERESRRNPARGAHRGQSVGSRWDYDYSHGGSVDTTSPENEAYFASMTQKVYTSDKDK